MPAGAAAVVPHLTQWIQGVLVLLGESPWPSSQITMHIYMGCATTRMPLGKNGYSEVDFADGDFETFICQIDVRNNSSELGPLGGNLW